MYAPSEIENFDMLSSYLRTTAENLSKFAHGDRYILDFKNPSSLSKIPKYTENQNRTDYLRFYIPKKNKKLGYRIIYKCYQQITKDILKVLKFNLNLIYSPNEYVHGFVKGRNIRSNALAHLGNKYLLKLDIKNFFESIDLNSVKLAFISLGYCDSIATDLARICTLDNKLVQGFPTSPIVANIVCEQLDIEINKICENYGATYTRYADDISISSNENLPSIEEISSILELFQFELNTDKTKKFQRGQNQYVTGLSICDTLYPRIPKAVKKRIRQQLYYIKKFGYHSHVCKINNLSVETDKSQTMPYIHELENNLIGWINYIHSIEPDIAKTFYELFNEIQSTRYADLKKIIEENNGVFQLKM